MKFFKKAKKGFTLVELVVVIAVIAILGAVSVGAYFGITDSANNSRLEQETKQIHTNISAIALGTSENQKLTSTGLWVDDIDQFELDLEENAGVDYEVLTSDPLLLSRPTIVLKQAAYTPANGQKIQYSTFEYHLPDISGKKVVSDVVTGDLRIEKIASIPVDTGAEDVGNNLVYFVNDKGWDKVHVYAWRDADESNNGAWPGPEMIALDDEGLYCAYLTSIFDKVLFSNGTDQAKTADLDVPVDTDENCYYASTKTWGTLPQGEIVVPEDTYSIAGKIGGVDAWATDRALTKVDDTTYTGTFTFEKGDQFKVRENGEWVNSWGFESVVQTDLYLESAGLNIQVYAAGEYELTFTLNPENKAESKITYVYNGTELPKGAPVDLDLYFYPGAWDVDGAEFEVYAFGNGHAEAWVSTVDSNDDGVYEFTISNKYEAIIFVRMDPNGTSENKWENKWQQTVNISFPEDETLVQFNIVDPIGTDENEKKATGEWTVFTVPEDDTPDTPIIDTPDSVGIIGDFRGSENWTVETKFTKNEDGTVWTLNDIILLKDESFKIRFDETWNLPNQEGYGVFNFGYDHLVEDDKALFDANGQNIIVKDDAKYSFTVTISATGTTIDAVKGDAHAHELDENNTCACGYIAPTINPDDEQTNTPKIYFITQTWWQSDSATTSFYYWGGTNAPLYPGYGCTLEETLSDGRKVWSYEIDISTLTGFIFARSNAKPGVIGKDWGAKTADLNPTLLGSNNCVVMTSTSPVWGDPGVAVKYATYVPGQTNY